MPTANSVTFYIGLPPSFATRSSVCCTYSVSAFLYSYTASVGEEELAAKWWEMGMYVALDSLQTEEL